MCGERPWWRYQRFAERSDYPAHSSELTCALPPAQDAAYYPLELVNDSDVATDQRPPCSAGSKRACPSEAFMRELDANTMANSSTSTTGAWLAGDQCRLRTAKHGSISDAPLRLTTPAEFEAHIRAYCRLLPMPIVTAAALRELSENKSLAGYQAGKRCRALAPRARDVDLLGA